MDYQQIKELAKAHKISVTDLIALAPQNDPFYTGSRSELAKAEWFAGLWRRFGYGRGIHLRRIHYQTQAQNPPIVKPDGKPYENTERCWEYLVQAGKYARYLDLVSVEKFIDMRNKDPLSEFAKWSHPGDWDYEDLTPRYKVDEGYGWAEYELPTLPALDDIPDDVPGLPEFMVEGYKPQYSETPQDYHIEIWSEKTTMNDVLIPLCRKYHVNFVVGAGELSITLVNEFLTRVRKSKHPARILYIADFDPAGLGMPISVARKIEFFQREGGYEDLDIRLQPVVLTKEQIEMYDLPRKPIKDSDRRKATFEAQHGKGHVELDALEALHPGELAQIVCKAVLAYFDETLTDRAREAKDDLECALSDKWQDIVDERSDDIADLERDYGTLWEAFSETRGKFSELVTQFQAEIDAHKESMGAIKARGEKLYGELVEELEQVEIDMDEHQMVEPELPPESPILLYDSAREYIDQLGFFKAYRSGINAHDLLDKVSEGQAR